MDKEKYEKIWIDGCIVLDTCTLDYISRCDFEHAKTIMDILLFCTDRVFVPQHVNKEMEPFFEKNIVHSHVDAHIKNLEAKFEPIYKLDIEDKSKKN